MNPSYQRLLHDSLAVSAGRAPDRVAALVSGVPHTYGSLLDAAGGLAATLEAAGIRRGDRVAIYADNTWPCLVAIFGALMAGGAFVVINPQTRADKLRYVLTDSGARALVTEGHLARVFAPVLADVPSISAVICAGALPHSSSCTVTSFDAAIGRRPILAGNPAVIPLDLAALIYTSGSTGHPKGVAMTHQAMAFNTGSLIEFLRLAGDDRILSVLPMAFNYGLYQWLMTVRLGATLVLERSFAYHAEVFQRILSEEVTVFPGVPTIFMTLVGIHSRSPLAFPSVRRVTNTAAALPPKILPALHQVFPHALIYLMYGLTECKRVCYLEPELVDVKPESVGKAVPGTEAFLLSEGGAPVPAGETGILHVRGPNVMLGYWNQPELTAHMLRPGRYPGERVLCTHDLFRMDADGCLYFVGRSDDIIKTRGEKVSPIEVENCLHGIPGVREAAVIGVPDDLFGEAVKAYVALEAGAALTDREIKAICAAKLENFAVPRDVVFLDELPKTSTGKIRKKDLAELS